MKPKVSVLLAVHNGERHLEEAIESVLGQTLHELELLVIDDGSTDATPRILQAAAHRDPRLRVHRIAHAGRSHALNLGCAHARSSLIARLDADDVALPTRLERQVAFLAANPDVVLLGGAALLIDERGRVFGEDVLPTDDVEIRRMLERASAFYHSNVVFRREEFEAVGGYRAAFEPAEDYDLWLRLAECNRLANLPEPVGKYRYSPKQESFRLVERQAVRALAARVSARDRRAGGRDRLGNVDVIDEAALRSIGVADAEIAEAKARHAAWLAAEMSRAGHRKDGAQLWRLARRYAASDGVPSSLRTELREQAKRAHGGPGQRVLRRVLARVRGR